MIAVAELLGQTGPTSTPQQAPQTAPQVKATLASYEGQNVATVELAGQPDLNPEELAPLVAQRAGEPFSQSKVDQTIAALQHSGRFQAVELEVRPEANGVRLLFVLQPAIYFGIYEFPGALKHFSFSRLVQVADYPPRGAYTPVDIEIAQQALEKFFKRNGYFLAEVHPEVQVDRVHGLANVIFGVTLKRKAKFGNVTLTGASPQETEHLQRVLHSWLARLRSSAIRPGKTYSLKTVQNATQYLENELTKQEHLGGRVKLIGANYDPKTNRADIAFNVVPGPVVKVKVQGAHLWSWTRRKLLPIYQQNGLDPELIQEGRQNLTSHFQSKGFFDAQVQEQTAVDQLGNTESVVYQVTKGPRHKVAAIRITGNQHIPTKDLLAHSQIEKAHILSHGKYSEHLARTTAKNFRRIYQANGFSEAKVTPQVSDTNGNLVVTFRVDEGQQEIVDSLRIEGNDNVPETTLAPKGLKVVAGQPYSTKRVDDDRNQIMAQLLNLGYLAATFHETARPVGGDKYKLEVVYQIYEGPEVKTASTVTVGRDRTRQALIDKTANIPVGRALREDQLLASESELYTLGIFDWAEIDPRRQITTQTQEDVVVKVHEAKRNEIIYGGGFEVVNRGGSVPSGTVALPGLPPVGLPRKFKTSQQTIWGPRGNFQYTRKNVRGRAETLSIGALASRLDQRGNITYSDPHFRESTNWGANLTLTGERNSENPIFASRLGEFGLQFQRPVNRDKTENVFVRYSFRETGLSRLLIPDLVPVQDRHVRLSTVSGSFIRDTRDSVLDAHKGIYETAELDLSPSQLGSSASFAKFLGQGAYYKNIGAGVVWANSLRLGLEQPISGSHVPISEQFFSGGGSTLRGFPLNGAGPQRTIPACGNPSDPSTCAFIRVPTGGNQLFIVNSEFRIPVPADLPLVGKKLGVAVFYDGGNVYQRIGFHNFGANYSNTIGGGVRYATPVGPVRVDFGHNLNPVTGIKSFQIFITLGQAF